MTAAIHTSAYCKIFLHASKNSSSAVGGYLIGSGSPDQLIVSDVVPICHNSPCGPMFEIAAEMTEKLHAGTQFRVLGYYFANETAVAMRPSYIDNIVKAIKMMNNGACLLFEIDNDLMSSSDALVLKATSDGMSVKINTTQDTIISINNIINQLLEKNFQRFLIDFEDHMDTAAGLSSSSFLHLNSRSGSSSTPGDSPGVPDFRNSFLIQAIADIKQK